MLHKQYINGGTIIYLKVQWMKVRKSIPLHPHPKIQVRHKQNQCGKANMWLLIIKRKLSNMDPIEIRG